MLMTLPLHPQSCSHSATTHRLAMLRPPHITCLKPRERRSLSAYLSHSHSPAVSSSSAYSPSPSRSPLLVCTLASDLRGGRLHVTWSDSRLASGAAAARCLLHVTSRPRRQRRTANGQRQSVAMAIRPYVSVRTHAHAHAPSQSTSTTHHDSCQKHMSRIDADDAAAPPSVMLTLRNHASSRHAPATSHHVPQAP